MINFYTNLLVKKPLITRVITSMGTVGLGDFLAQKLIEKK
jgi:hypothetical protein